MFRISSIVFVLLLFYRASADNIDAQPDDTIYDTYRLPTAVTPENYKLNIITHLNDTEGFLFRGSVWITVRELKTSCSQLKKWI